MITPGQRSLLGRIPSNNWPASAKELLLLIAWREKIAFCCSWRHIFLGLFLRHILAQEARAHAQPHFQQQTHQSRQRAALQVCMLTTTLLQTDQPFFWIMCMISLQEKPNFFEKRNRADQTFALDASFWPSPPHSYFISLCIHATYHFVPSWNTSCPPLPHTFCFRGFTTKVQWGFWQVDSHPSLPKCNKPQW